MVKPELSLNGPKIYLSKKSKQNTIFVAPFVDFCGDAQIASLPG
jgi:hypothetical protein